MNEWIHLIVLFSFRYRFSQNGEALSALHEAIQMAQEAGDAICLQYALGWLHLINEQGDGNGKWSGKWRHLSAICLRMASSLMNKEMAMVSEEVVKWWRHLPPICFRMASSHQWTRDGNGKSMSPVSIILIDSHLWPVNLHLFPIPSISCSLSAPSSISSFPPSSTSPLLSCSPPHNLHYPILLILRPTLLILYPTLLFLLQWHLVLHLWRKS